MATPSIPFADARAADVLSDPTRRAIYQFVKRQHEPLSVNQVADQFAMHRNAAKFHLDKLLAAGLLQAEFRRINGRRGPGAGRPSKLYSATDVEVQSLLPERHYEVLATLLLRSLISGTALEQVGYDFGAELARERQAEGEDRTEAVRNVLESLGFNPEVSGGESGELRITTENCPFQQVAMHAPDGEVCLLDHALIRGVLEVFGPQVEVHEAQSMRTGHDVCVREVRSSRT